MLLYWILQAIVTQCYYNINIIIIIYRVVQFFLRPFNNYSIFFLQLPLSFQSPSINPFSPISPLIPSAQVSLGLPRILLPGGCHFITYFGSLPSSILWTWPYHWSCFVLISSKRDLVTFIFCLIIVFLILSFLEILAERRQKTISVEFNFVVVFAFKRHVSGWMYPILILYYNIIILWDHCRIFGPSLTEKSLFGAYLY